MKIRPEHHAHMKQAIEAISPRIPAIRAAIAVDRRSRDIDKRLRWDCAYAAGLNRFICDDIYGYANDEHIDTALRSIMRDILPTIPPHVPSPEQPTRLFRDDRFLVLDHGELGVQVKFRIAGVDGPTEGSRWFTDGAGEQIRQVAARMKPGSAGPEAIERLAKIGGPGEEEVLLPLVPGR